MVVVSIPDPTISVVVSTVGQVIKKLIRYLVVSGLSAAHTLYLAGANVLVLDKQGLWIRNLPVHSGTKFNNFLRLLRRKFHQGYLGY